MTRFDEACSGVEAALTGTARPDILNDLSKSKDLGKALVRLRESMRSNVWRAGGRHIDLDAIVEACDSHARQSGFHVLHDWDGKADRVNEDTIAVDVLNYVMDQRGSLAPDRAVLAILLDYYFVYLLALLSLSAWEDGSADGNLDRLNHLLGELQGPNGSGHRFAGDAETLFLIATSHFELDDSGYDAFLEKAGSLNHAHRTSMALVHAASLGGHLRFGFEATYGRDTVAMRDDNGVDYRWLCFALATLMTEYARLHEAGIRGTERDVVVEAILNGLTPDARAFIGEAPASLSACAAERAGFCELFHRYHPDLLQEFERHRPSTRRYSPISLFFNFSHNVVKGAVVDALLRGEAWNVSLNDLLTGIDGFEPDADSKEKLATTLMGYARSNPDTIRGRLMPVIVYDPQTGREAFNQTLRKIRG